MAVGKANGVRPVLGERDAVVIPQKQRALHKNEVISTAGVVSLGGFPWVARHLKE